MRRWPAWCYWQIVNKLHQVQICHGVPDSKIRIYENPDMKLWNWIHHLFLSTGFFRSVSRVTIWILWVPRVRNGEKIRRERKVVGFKGLYQEEESACISSIEENNRGEKNKQTNNFRSHRRPPSASFKSDRQLPNVEQVAFLKSWFLTLII